MVKANMPFEKIEKSKKVKKEKWKSYMTGACNTNGSQISYIMHIVRLIERHL